MMTMKGIQVVDFGGPNARSFSSELKRSEIGNTDILVRNHFAGVNFKDLLLCQGRYHGGTPDLPFTLGIEAAGVIAEVGSNVTQ